MVLDGHRELNEDEKRFCEKNLEGLREQVNSLQFNIEYADLMLSKGLKANYMRQLAEFKVKKRQAAAELTDLQFAIGETEFQLKNGVKEKTLKEPEGDE